MGRPEPSVMFSQTFVHPHLDEFVDEVIFAEPVVITACEFLELNASSGSSSVTLIGATSPPSFALEVFVQCEGETRFRRLCQPFLYSHSSSNVLEVEAVVTNHLVVRGSYRSLSLVIYGNTAEDLGQFNVEVDLDSSLTTAVCPIEGDIEDLPPALHPTKRTIEELISSPKALSLEVVASDISVDVKLLLEWAFKILQFPDLGDAGDKVISSLASVASCFAPRSLYCPVIGQKQSLVERPRNYDGESHFILAEARKELLDIYKSLHQRSGNRSAESLEESSSLESEADMVTSKQLMDSLNTCFHYDRTSGNTMHPQLLKNKGMILWLSAALLLCSGRESCFHFVNAGGMEQLRYVFCSGLQNSHAIMLMLLGVVEQATRYSIGCEGFLGWWPREDESVPSGTSEGYNQLLKLLLQKQLHDASYLSTRILHRLGLYEVVSRYESAVLSVLGSLSPAGKVTSVTMDMISDVKQHLKKLMKFVSSRGPVEDPSPLTSASRSLLLGETEGVLSYESTSSLITSSNCRYSSWDIDQHLLSLLKERGFFPLSAALLSCSVLRSETGRTMDIFVDIALYLEEIILSLLFCRSGLLFLLQNPELSTTLIVALRGADDLSKEESLPLRYASVLISKGFFCHLQEIGIIVQTHLRVVIAIDRLLASNPQSEEILWVLWELCGLSRSHCGREALLALGLFPEAVSVLISAFHSIKELDPLSSTNGASALNLAVFHSAAEIFEVVVSGLTASTMAAWIGHAAELHRALHSSSPGSNRKDAPTRLLEWIDASMVYHKKGATGLLKYASLLASGGDAHTASTSILSSEMMEVENSGGDSSTGSDSNLIENLIGKPISENNYQAAVLRDASVVQLTTAFRILAFISKNSAVAAALYEEGAVMVIHAVLINCRLMLERSSNNYDYLVDEGTECNSTSDLLLERNREQSIVDLLIPCLALLITLLQRLQEANEQHRNTKLVKALVELHREVSPRLAACAVDVSSPYPGLSLGFQAVTHLLVSTLACWPVYGWTPGLFHYLVDSLHATSSLALGPKEACSLLCLLSDLFPEEGFWLWKNGMPMLSALRTLAVGTLLGPQKERQIGWFLQPEHLEMLLSQLTPQLDKIAQIILHCAVSTLIIIQDMLRVFIIRIARLNADHARILVRPIMSSICNCLSEPSSLSDADAYKVYRLLDFLALLLEHPRSKPLLLKEGAVEMLTKVLERCIAVVNSDGKQLSDSRTIAKWGFSQITWCVPVLMSLSLLSESRTFPQFVGIDRQDFDYLTSEDYLLIFSYILNLCKVLPVGRELLACLSAFKEFGLCSEGQSAFRSILSHVQTSSADGYDSDSRPEKDRSYNLINTFDWRQSPPFLCCWITLLRSLDSKDVVPDYAIEAVGTLSCGALCICLDGKSLNYDRVIVLKYLFGLPFDTSQTDDFTEDNLKYIEDLSTLLNSWIIDEKYPAASDVNSTLCQVKKSVKSLLNLLQTSMGSIKQDDIISSVLPSSSSDVPVSSKMHKVADGSSGKSEDYNLGLLADNFIWECPENLRDRLSQTALPLKRKVSPLESANRRTRDNSAGETVAQNAFSRNSGPASVPSGPTRRDTFRQRKPNSSRPPSMHVDDYVARERNVEGTSSSNVIAVTRIGSTSGRPPSIHVDEFMARQRDRQNPVGMGAGDAMAQVKITPPEGVNDAGKSKKPKQLKPDLDDDLQGIDIVFDGDESESDDKLPFPQSDYNLQQPASVIAEQRSPHSVVEETDSDVNESGQFSHLGTPSASHVDENTPSEFSRMSVSHSEFPFAWEPSISSDRRYYEETDDTKNIPVKSGRGFDSHIAANSGGYSASVRKRTAPVDSRMHSPLHPKNTLQQTGTLPLASSSQRPYDSKFQPPLPPMPPPSAISPILTQPPDSVSSRSSPFVNSMADVQAPAPPGFPVQKDSKYNGTSISSSNDSSRPPPPLPPTPPPYSASTLPSLRYSASQSTLFNQTSVGTTELLHTSIAPLNDFRVGTLSASGTPTSYLSPQMMPHLIFSRPASIPIPIPSIQSLPSVAQLQPLQRPQILYPPQPPQHLRPPIPASEQGVSLLQSPAHMQGQPFQMLQQPQVSPLHVYYQPQQQENSSHTQAEQNPVQVLYQQGEGTSQQQQDDGMSLQHYFSSPEALQSLLSDRDKLCQLLEQHPKLMESLQKRLGLGSGGSQ